jgi:hypothetical protein
LPAPRRLNDFNANIERLAPRAPDNPIHIALIRVRWITGIIHPDSGEVPKRFS